MIPEDTEAEHYARKAPDPAPRHREGGPMGWPGWWAMAAEPSGAQKRRSASTATTGGRSHRECWARP